MIRLFLLRFFETYFRHRWLHLIPVVLLIAASVFYFMTLKPKYVAKGVLYVNNTPLLTSLTNIPSSSSDWWITPAQATTNELNELNQTDAFIRAVIKDTNLEVYMQEGQYTVSETIQAVRRSFVVYPYGNNEVMIGASFEDAEIAHQLVNSIINSYVSWQINTRRMDSQVAKGFFNDLLVTYEEELNAARQRLRDFYLEHSEPINRERPASEKLEIDRLEAEVNLAASRYRSALDNEENAKLALAQIESEVHQTYVLLDAPLMPDRPELSKRAIAMQAAIFLSAGILLSIMGVGGSLVLDRSIRFPVDVEKHFSLPVLSVIPDFSLGRKPSKLPVFSRPGQKSNGHQNAEGVLIDLAEMKPVSTEEQVIEPGAKG